MGYVLSEVLVTFAVHDSEIRVVLGRFFATPPNISAVISGAGVDEMGSLVDKRSGPEPVSGSVQKPCQM